MAIILIAALSQLSETVYTPSIAQNFSVSHSYVEYSLTIYLFTFAIGTLFWGIISDSFGRKPCLIVDLIIFISGCIVCYLANSIEVLILFRFIQRFGSSVGSVLGQCIFEMPLRTTKNVESYFQL